MNTKFLYELRPGAVFYMVIGDEQKGPFKFLRTDRENHMAICKEEEGEEFEITTFIPVVAIL